MNRRAPLPSHLVGNAFHVRAAREAGVPWRRLDAADLDHLVRGSRVPVGGTKLDAVRAVFAPDQAFTGPTAAALWRMPLPRRWQEDPDVWVSTLSRDRSMRRPGVVARRRMGGTICSVRGYPVLDPAHVWASLAEVLEPHDLIAVADRIITDSPRLKAIASLSDLREITSTRRRHVRRLREALDGSRSGAWSRPETLLRLALVRAGVPEPRLNVEVPVGRGRNAAPDLAWPEWKVCAEYDGFWHDDPRRRAEDLERHELLVDAGWLIAHIRARDLFPHPLPAVARVLTRLSSVGYRHSGVVERALLPSWLP